MGARHIGARHTGAFDGLGALVTGGASGIGLATARMLAAEGARVAVLDRAAPEEVPQVTSEAASEGQGLVYVRADIGDDASVVAGVGEAVAALGGLDVLVNNAGIGAQGGIEDNGDDEWHRVLDINVVGLVRVTRAALPALRASAHASVVNIGSIAATAGLPQRALYSATKGAVLSLTRAMAADLLPEGIRVNAVNPGTADTPWVCGCWSGPTTRRPNTRRWRRGSRTAGWSAPTRSPPPSSIWPPRPPPPRRAPPWPWTAVWTGCV